MTTNDQGDIATLTLTVTPAAGDTSATLAVTSPTGLASAPSTTPNSDRSVWTALLPLTEPGEYIARWTVTGTGAGVEQQTITARPTLPVVIAGQRVYATTADLAYYLEAAPPSGARRMLRHASAVIEQATKCAIYETDTNGYPTDATILQAFKDATCAQVHWWSQTGDELGTGGQWNSVSIGSVSLSGRQSDGGSGDQLAAAARSYLAGAGLLGTVSQYQRWEGSWV